MGSHKNLDQFDVIEAERLTDKALGLNHANRKVVSLTISGDLKALETCLVETDPASTEVVVVACHTPAEAGSYGDPEQAMRILAAPRTTGPPDPPLGHEDRKLLTAVVNRAEVAGKPVKPVVILTEDPQTELLRRCGPRGDGTVRGHFRPATSRLSTRPARRNFEGAFPRPTAPLDHPPDCRRPRRAARHRRR